MSVVILAFWTSLLIPGYAVLRRADPDGAESGLLGAIALSFLAAATVLSAIAIPGYLLGAPLWILSLGIVAFVVWGVVDLTRSRQWRPIGRLLAGAVGLELIIVAADMVLGARIGTLLGADAVVHVGRVRFLLEQGLLNHDQFVAGGFFYPIYHTNLLHALVASSAQVTGVDHAGAWFAGLAFAKLLIVSGAWYAGWAIFRSGAAAWVTALFVLGHRGPVSFVLYPNQLAPWFLVPLLVGYAVRAAGGKADWRCAGGIAATSLLIGEVHGLYGVFVAMSVGPALGGWAVVRWWRRAPDRRAAVACAAALAVALPFPAVTFATIRSASAAGAANDAIAAAGVDATVDAESGEATTGGRERSERAAGEGGGRGPGTALSNKFRKFENGWVMHRFGRGFTGNRGFRVLWLFAASALAVIVGRRREVGFLLAVLAGVAAWLYVPPLCAAFMRLAGAEWMIHRFAMLQDILFALLVPGAVVAVVEMAITRAAAADRAPALAGHVFRWAFGVACIYAGAFNAHLSAPYTWSRYLDRGLESRSARLGRDLRPLRRFGEDLRTHVPEGAVVLADPSVGMKVVMMHDCRIVASASSSVGVPRLGRRAADVRRMMRGSTDPDERQRLLDEYGITHLVLPRPARRWTYERMREFWVTEFGLCIIALRAPDEPPGEVLGDYDRALLDVDRTAEAIEVLRRKVARQPEHFGAHFRLGNALLAVRRHLDAVASFRTARALRPEDPRPAIMIGNAYAELDRIDLAIDAYEETIEIAARVESRDALASAWYNLGNMHYRVGAWDDAMAAYREALRVRRGHAAALHWLTEAGRRAAGEGAPEDSEPPPAEVP